LVKNKAIERKANEWKSSLGDDDVRAFVLLPPSVEENVCSAIYQELERSRKINTIVLKYNEADEDTFITKLIEISDIVLFDISANDPSILYFVGYAHALRKKVMLFLRQGSPIVPFALRGYLYTVFDESDLNTLLVALRNWCYHNLPFEKIYHEKTRKKA
jgi:hypothetical protein